MTLWPRRGWWQRLRHGRGFGVHSPSAYRFIREVLCERLPYYSYPEVDALAASWPGGRKHARLLLRLTAHAQPHVAAVGEGAMSEAAAKIVRMGCAATDVRAGIDADTDFIVLTDGQADAAFRAAARGATIVMPDRHTAAATEVLRRVQTELRFGHCFVNGDGAAVFVGRDVPAETFAVRF